MSTLETLKQASERRLRALEDAIQSLHNAQSRVLASFPGIAVEINIAGRHGKRGEAYRAMSDAALLLHEWSCSQEAVDEQITSAQEKQS